MPRFFLKPNTFSVHSASVNVDDYPIAYQRGSDDSSPSYAFDYLSIGSISYSSDRKKIPTPDEVEKLNAAIYRTFLAKKEISSAVFGDPKAFSEVIASHQAIVSRLEESLTTVGEKFSAERLRLLTEAESESKELEAAYQSKVEQLAAEAEKLEERKKLLDDRDNTHARREIRADLKRRIQEHASSFNLTTGTRRLRWPIHIAALVSLTVIGWLIVSYSSSTVQIAGQQSFTVELIALLIKSIGLTIAFLGIITWYIRWMNRWFERHSEAEFQLKQFELDVDRASWVVETALEWRQTQDSTMPAPLIESISRNLFSKSEKDESADMNPADYLASALLGRASGLRLKLPMGELEYGPKALKEAAKTADRAKGDA